ncbi:MAG: hypothetical protein HKN81_09065 [Gammaproteobacteria bacterium]|nr:hypothetical protein [Gammaproteobacteria bacterium]NND37268.1 hypothetical protein [Gammaproteobacteria bacterium]
MLGRIKSLLRDQIGMPATVVLVAVGLLAHLALTLLLRKSPTSALGLLAPLGLGLVIESWEIWVQYRDVGLTAPGNDPVPMIVARHAIDVLKMLAAPATLVLAGTLRS